VRSPVGVVLRGIRENPLRTAAVGHNVHSDKLAAFVIAAAYAGFAGGLLGVLQAFMPPEAFTFETSGQLVIQTAIGGRGMLFGPLAGAALWLFLQDFLQGPLGLGATWKLVLGLVFVVLVVFLRDGILGGIRDLYRLVARRKAEKATSIAAPAKAPARPPAAAPATVRTHAGNGFSGPIMQTISLFKVLTCEVSSRAATSPAWT
jgi:branched-chain amino acid transport system ATP-binding protein/branched-chain amino acid transport system permease protein